MGNKIKSASIFIITLLVFWIQAGSILLGAIKINSMTFTQFSSVNPGQDWNSNQPVFVSNVEFFRLFNPANISEVEEGNAVANDSLLIGKPYNYPNPFSLRDGGTKIGYHLKEAADVEIRIYDMRAHEIYRNEFSKGQPNGGVKGDNLVPITFDSFNNVDLSSGIYFFVVLADGDVIGKGKMALKP